MYFGKTTSLLGFTVQRTGLGGSRYGAAGSRSRGRRTLIAEKKFVNPATFPVTNQIKDMAAWAATKRIDFVLIARDADRLCPNVKEQLSRLNVRVVDLSSAVQQEFWRYPYGGFP